MKLSVLSPDEVLAGYDAVSGLYPYIPPMSVWRAWEYAAYRRYALPEPVIDIGCGDGRFFQFVWPRVRDVVGVDRDADVIEAARRSGVYRETYAVPAHRLPGPPGTFASAFANCSLEHMDYLSEVLRSISEGLRPGAPFLLSVVTDRFLEWAALPRLVGALGEPARARELQAEYEAYHHLVNPLPVEVWTERLEEAGFEVLEHVALLPELTSRLFLFLDHLWHVPRPGGELGDALAPFLTTLSDFPAALRQVLMGVLRMERDWSTGSGAVFQARRKPLPGARGDLADGAGLVDRQWRGLPEAENAAPGQPLCWCGNTDLDPFSAGYFRCARCETLVWGQMPGPEVARVVDEGTELYGREYWFSHQERDLGVPNILARARADLGERCLYWLRALLKRKLPPSQILELGSGPGSFVATLRWAGFDATGLELSPWVVRFIRETFQVPVMQGPVEDQQIEPASLDVIALMDVLEHLRDPVGTMRHCLSLLKPDGILLIQTPCYAEGRTYEEMIAEGDRFVEMLQPTDHLYLFSRRSLCDFFRRLGAPHVAFDPPLFEYDMLLAVSRAPHVTIAPAEIDAALSVRPSGRVIQALLDVDASRTDVRQRLVESDTDRAARLEQLRVSEAARQAEVAQLAATLRQAEADGAARLGQVDELARLLRESEADRAARLDQIHDLSRLLQESEADRAARLDVIRNLEARVAAIERTWAWRLYTTLPASLVGRKPVE
jgi:SAM-dependent methyltransferase